MSNNKNNREQDKVLIDVMHPNQLNPGLAKPEDFKVKTPAEAAREKEESPAPLCSDCAVTTPNEMETKNPQVI
jgi:hypothetical protein